MKWLQEEGVQRASMMPDQVQYYFQLAQQHQANLQQQQQAQQPAVGQTQTQNVTQVQPAQQTQQIQLQGMCIC